MIGFATVTLHIKHYKDKNGVESIDIKQTLTGGIEGTQENRTLDWVERPHEDKIFGKSGSCVVCYVVQPEGVVYACIRQLARIEGSRLTRSIRSS